MKKATSSRKPKNIVSGKLTDPELADLTELLWIKRLTRCDVITTLILGYIETNRHLLPETK